MKRFFRYLVCVIVLSFVPSLCGDSDADAQWIVADPTQTATNLSSFLEQIANGLEQLGLSEEHLKSFNKTKEWLDNIQGSEAMRAITEFTKQLGLYHKLYHNIDYAVNMINRLYGIVDSMVSYGYSTAMVNSMMTYMIITLRQLNVVKDNIEAILSAKNLTFGEKLEQTNETLEKSQLILDNTSTKVAAELQALEEMRSMVAFTNWLSDRPASFGLGGVGADYSDVDDLEEIEEDSVSHEDFVSEGGLGSGVFRFAVLVIGILCVIALCVAVGRYMQGTPGAEMMFVRILAAGFGSFIVLFILSKVFNLNGF